MGLRSFFVTYLVHLSFAFSSGSCRSFRPIGSTLLLSGMVSVFPQKVQTGLTFRIAYPTWDMKAELKAYYLIQFAYWLQQLLVLMLGLEKPRSDYRALVAHHFVTVWLIGCVMCILLVLFFLCMACTDGAIL